MRDLRPTVNNDDDLIFLKVEHLFRAAGNCSTRVLPLLRKALSPDSAFT